jgi:ABC-2 type transport system permease protein
MGSGVVEQSRTGDVGGFLGSQLGTTDPSAGYLAYVGTLVGIVASTFAVLGVLRARNDEASGLADHLLVTGIRRWSPLAAQVVVTGIGLAVVLLAAAGLSALVAPRVIDGPDVALRAAVNMLGQWPAAMALAGLAALLIGLWPRWSALAWAPPAASAVLALIGGLLGVPQPVRDLGVFLHVPDPVTAPDLSAPLVLVAVAVAATLAGLIGTARRDVAAG